MDRIDLLASLASGSSLLADIGSDHGYTVIQAVKYYNVKKALACDIKEQPLMQAKKNILNEGLSSKIGTLLSDGFEKLDNSFDTAIISGMGGILIVDILTAGLKKIKGKKLIIEANTDTPLVRRFLTENGFVITDEKAIFDNEKYYEIIVAETGEQKLSEIDILFGPVLRRKKSSDFLKHYKDIYNQYTSFIASIKDAKVKEEKLVYFRYLLCVLAKGKYEKHFIGNTKNYYEEYFLDNKKRPLILVSPGGGYKYCSPRESAPIAMVFNNFGYHVVVVNYREEENLKYPMLSAIYANVGKMYRLDSRVSEIIGLGFSAGAHNVLEVGLHRQMYEFAPDLMILGYPVVSSDPAIWHEGSFRNLLLDDFENDDLRRRVSLDLEVKPGCPDLFLWGTITDEAVPVENSFRLLQAYKKAGCNVEYHLYPEGGHGLSSCDFNSAEGNSAKINSYIGSWLNLANSWIQKKIN